ncbi:hypothetical protein [Haliscomenobacter sp.]|jgi:hypothetical protein|uniref:hypothetical protein n=1 Tax=Haliscomenobacter sp. TaxID=2717303 RepID=UPI003365030D
MKLVVLAISLALTACSTLVPVTMTFPEAPGRQAQVACPNLQKLKDDALLSDVSRTITINYSTYYECAVKTDAWIEWYEIQRRIFEGVVK